MLTLFDLCFMWLCNVNFSDVLYKKLINGVDHYFRIRPRPLDDTDDNGNKVLTF